MGGVCAPCQDIPEWRSIPGTSYWSETIAACDKIIDKGGFSLVQALYDQAGSVAVFGDILPNEEVLLSVFVDGNDALRNIIGIRSLYGPHGNALFGFSTWNGSTVHHDFINKYDDTDKRKAQWLLGTQPGEVNYTLTRILRLLTKQK